MHKLRQIFTKLVNCYSIFAASNQFPEKQREGVKMPIHLFDFSDEEFKHIISQPQFALPIRWDGQNFEVTLGNLFCNYRDAISTEIDLSMGDKFSDAEDDIRKLCSDLLECVKLYHKGFPSRAFEVIEKIMGTLVSAPLNIYQDLGWCEPFYCHDLELFRLRKATDTASHERKEMFHVPASMRSLVSTCRYSIAGYPSLYLTTSVELGLEELGADENALVSSYRLVKPGKMIQKIDILDLGIKPQDFTGEGAETSRRFQNGLNRRQLSTQEVQARYLLWYPVIAACSFIRAYKSRPFASEYIVPQLIMQWLRRFGCGKDLMGIRYFPCASIRASDLGFDYVFPVSSIPTGGEYCSDLQSHFELTMGGTV